MADNEIVQKVRSGKKECFEVLMRRHTQALFRVGRMFDFDPRDIEDLIADTHMQAFRSLSRFSPNSTYRAWLTRIMIEKCSRKLEHSFSTSHPAGGAPASNYNSATKLPGGNAAVAQSTTMDADVEGLPLPLRSFFVLREVEGFSEKETASLLNVSEDCVKEGTSRAKLSVKKSLRRNLLGDTVYPFGTSACERVVSSVMSRL